MGWEVEGTEEFSAWFVTLGEADRSRIAARIDLLAERGPALGRPTAESIKGARTANMKELRSGSIRVLFVFDPTSRVVLLLGGNKKGDWIGWYHRSIPIADRMYDRYRQRTKDEDDNEVE
jgi:hypothetical protein